jgi:ribonuclease P protein component
VAERQKRRRLSRSAEFDRVYRKGRSAGARHLVLYAFPRERDGADESEGARLGVSVGRRVGGAVARNRVKRLLREAFWSLESSLADDRDWVIVARAEAAALAERDGLEGLKRELAELAQRLDPGSRDGRDDVAA